MDTRTRTEIARIIHMKCPACNLELIVIEFDQIEIDHCPSCNGIWLDTTELQLLFDGLNQTNNWFESLRDAASISEKRRSCPICDQKMAKAYFETCDDKILLDRCMRNDGVWCDEGELQRLVKAQGVGDENQVVKLLQKVFLTK